MFRGVTGDGEGRTGNERPGPTVSLDRARDELLSVMRRLAPSRVPLGDSIGHVLAEAVVARVQVPSFANAAMDGFAVRSADVTELQCRLHLIGAVRAGTSPWRIPPVMLLANAVEPIEMLLRV
jgi:molybdopterin biosynthesis enzyme